MAARGDDSQNVYVSLTARGFNPDLYIVARASRPAAEENLPRAQAPTTWSYRTSSARQRWRSQRWQAQ